LDLLKKKCWLRFIVVFYSLKTIKKTMPFGFPALFTTQRSSNFLVVGQTSTRRKKRRQDGDWHGTRGRLWLSEDAIQELTGSSAVNKGPVLGAKSLGSGLGDVENVNYDIKYHIICMYMF
jgi:hypothetical protein